MDQIAPPVVAARRRQSVARIIGELWESRDLVVQFMLRDITIRYAQAVMGFAWALVDRDRQFLHDRLAGTALVEAAPPKG